MLIFFNVLLPIYFYDMKVEDNLLEYIRCLISILYKDVVALVNKNQIRDKYSPSLTIYKFSTSKKEKK